MLFFRVVCGGCGGGAGGLVRVVFNLDSRLGANRGAVAASRTLLRVAVKRGRLAGVDDTVVIPFRHREPGTRPRNKAGERLHAAILKRLKIKPKRVAMAE